MCLVSILCRLCASFQPSGPWTYKYFGIQRSASLSHTLHLRSACEAQTWLICSLLISPEAGDKKRDNAGKGCGAAWRALNLFFSPLGSPLQECSLSERTTKTYAQRSNKSSSWNTSLVISLLFLSGKTVSPVGFAGCLHNISRDKSPQGHLNT